MLAIFGRRQKQTWYNMELGMYKLGSIWDPHVAHLFNPHICHTYGGYPTNHEKKKYFFFPFGLKGLIYCLD